MPSFEIWMSADDLKDLAQFTYGLCAEDVEELYRISHLEQYGWAEVSAEDVLNVAKHIVQNVSEQVLNNIAFWSRPDNVSRTNEQIIGAVVDDVMDMTTRTHLEF